ncbi:MAG: peptide chain release factor N(5)-glutamine methyltransferase [Actinobacteria bacterium]|uniref:peptide chain release factor N(5)-glutamine methyltransferase n=1 Tax=freshwater metagenome TaxID=449393 RepID=A0A6J6B3A5_9ZZZZ|nr:peptide chain release factor N(5)-glutamine methyltransferase [Actinomycetota bacterium]MTA29340.1 peptide chain release factor N(5)-glutamine methyltransferase [Actinomycetota bacterium]
MLLSELLARGTELLTSAGVESAEVDAQLLAAHVLGFSRGELQAKSISNFEIDDVGEIEALFQKRSERIPLQHLTGVAYFRNLALTVAPGVFIPRPETEVVTEFAVQALRAVPGEPIAVDLCTGSGAIAISLATEVSNSLVYAWELNPDSEKPLRQNIEANGGGVQLTMGDIAKEHPLFQELAGRVDVVVSNPPYIPTGAVPVDVEVQLHEPELALYGGADGMDIMKVVSKRALQLLKPGGFLVVEHADSQAKIVADLFEADGWRQIRSHRDLNARDRATTAVKAF